MSDARKYSSEKDMLEASRDSSRTYGCFGVSFIAHAALLAALAIIPFSIHSIGGDDAGGRESGAVSLVDSGSSGDAAMEAASGDIAKAQSLEGDVNSVAQSAPITDVTSEVVVPANDPKPVEAVIVKPRAKIETAAIPAPVPAPAPKKVSEPKPQPVVKAAPTKAASAKIIEANDEAAPVVETRDTAKEEELEQAPAPVLLANPPADDEKSEPTPVEEEPTKPEPVKPQPVAKTETKPAQPAPVAEPKKEEEPAPPVEAAKPIAAAKQNETAQKESAEAASSDNDSNTSGNSAAKSTSGNSGHSGSAHSGSNENAGGEEGNGESSGSVAGPVRDASELKALPGNPNPVYPARDRLAKREGTAVVLGRVSPDGRVSEVSVERSSGSPQMDAASAQAFRSWRFQAGQQGWVRKPFQFRLVGDAKEIPAPLGKTLKR